MSRTEEPAAAAYTPHARYTPRAFMESEGKSRWRPNAFGVDVTQTHPLARLTPRPCLWRGSVWRTAFRGIAPSYPLLALIICLFYSFAMLGMELLGCVDGLEFGRDPSLPHASFDTLDWSLLTVSPAAIEPTPA